MFDEVNICPYTGLRSFTEEESIYFKGRDEHIEEATAQLARNKFLMLTGASGDGKSSLVYAGIIPNARAGFLKARYTHWNVADFRPERDPFKNLCRSVSRALDIPSESTVASELGHGFSALVDLYKSSKRYVDEDSDEWREADDESKKEMRRASSNLLILVDQFEEFFTNPENYRKGATSNDANLVINLLLETARQSLEENLPIYIVFTMRSDFIGQCAAFRGLPEYIGFSQFFVPRLNRKQLQEVIEDPAVLSGNQISRRLTERLIHDVIEGVDQLPILQHALNQIWKAADEGGVELDLIHYAKVGGMAEEELPKEDQEVFHAWFTELPQVIRECYSKPGLQKVLDTHANKIFSSAAYEYNKRTGKTIELSDAHAIIQVTFNCLTKIDESRAVRNRMTLEEITSILGKPSIDNTTVSDVIAIFRESGNTFIKPFITDEASKSIPADTVLDITHESLIRNWEMLEIWAKEEFDKFMILKDFKQQVDRWLEYNKSWGFLLPIGSLTYFENWFEKTKPNPHWVNRYNELVTDTAKNIEESKEIVRNSKEYLKRSGQKHAIARAVFRFGPKKIAAVMGVLVILLTSSFIVFDNMKKQNEYVLQHAMEDGESLLAQDLTDPITRANYVIARERLQPGDGIRVMEKISDPINRFTVAVATAQTVNSLNSKSGSNPFVFETIHYASSVANDLYDSVIQDKLPKNEYYGLLAELIAVAEHNVHFNGTEEMEQQANQLASLLGAITMDGLRSPWSGINMKELNEGLEYALIHHAFSREEMEEIAAILSPFEKERVASKIVSEYSRNKTMVTGLTQDKLTYNGLYQILGELYASLGNAELAGRAVDTLYFYDEHYEDLTTDGYSIGGHFVSYGHWSALREYAENLATLFEIHPYQVYQRMADRMGYRSSPIGQSMRFDALGFFSNVWANPVLDQMPDSSITDFQKEYQGVIQDANVTNDEKNYALATYFKQIGIFAAKKYEDRGLTGWEGTVDELFEQSVKYYRQVGQQYKSGMVATFFRLPERAPRSQIYQYPDYRQEVHHFEPRSRFVRYYSDAFIRYVLENELYDEFYSTKEGQELIVNWIKEYTHAIWDHTLMKYYANPVATKTLVELHNKLGDSPYLDELNTTLLNVMLAQRYFELGEKQQAIEYADQIDPVAIPGAIGSEWGYNVGKAFDIIKTIYAHLILEDEIEIADRIMGAFNSESNLVRLFDQAAVQAYWADNKIKGDQYLDSASQIRKSMQSGSGGGFGGLVNYNTFHAYALFLSGDAGNERLALDYVNVLNSYLRISIGYRTLVNAKAAQGKYFEAMTLIPNPSPEEKLISINELLTVQDGKAMVGWETYDRNWSFYLFFSGYSFGG